MELERERELSHAQTAGDLRRKDTETSSAAKGDAPEEEGKDPPQRHSPAPEHLFTRPYLIYARIHAPHVSKTRGASRVAYEHVSLGDGGM